MRNTIKTALVALVAGFAGAALFAFSGLGNSQTRSYLVANPEILPEMAAAFQAQEISARVAAAPAEMREPFRGAVLGNPEGSKTLVKFTDYGCGFCRESVADIERLVQEDPDLRIVVREWPIFQGSEDAALMALAAARQGRYEAFYKAMFASGPPNPASIEAAARKAGLDLEQARAFAASEEALTELRQNDAFARQLGFGGTPSWVAGDRASEGAIGYEALAEMVDAGEG